MSHLRAAPPPEPGSSIRQYLPEAAVKGYMPGIPQ